MKFNVVGAGALGKYYGGLLAHSGQEVTFLVHSEYRSFVQEATITLNEGQKSLSIPDVQYVNDPCKLDEADVVLVCLKTTANEQLSTLLAPSLSPKTLIVIVQNGIGNEERVQALFPDNPIVGVISTVAATVKQPKTVDVFFAGELRMAPFSGDGLQAQALSPVFDKAGIKHQWFENHKAIRWNKLLWNVPFNFMSILYDKDSATLASQTPFSPIVRSLMEEVRTIAQFEGVELNHDMIEKYMAHTQSLTDYYPSMYWDHAANRPIEREYLLDNVIAIANKHRIETPMLKLIEKKLEEMGL